MPNYRSGLSRTRRTSGSLSCAFDRPSVNAFDQRMWDLFDAVTASPHGDTLYRAVVITGGLRLRTRGRPQPGQGADP
jgi:enoyl-CoA hydratase/carnithine racemase